MKNLQRICFREQMLPATPGDDLPRGVRERYTISYWVEFADGCLFIDGERMKLHRCTRVPADAKPVPVVDDELCTGSLPRSFLGVSLLSVAEYELYELRFDNGGIINFGFEYYYFTDGPSNGYLSPGFFSPAWLAAPENAELAADWGGTEEEPRFIDLASLPAAQGGRAEDMLPPPAASQPEAGLEDGDGWIPAPAPPPLHPALSLLRLYGLLLWFALALFPLVAGLGAWTCVPIVLFWLASLLLRRVRPERCLPALGLVLAAVACAIALGYGWWRARIGVPTYYAEGWYWFFWLDFPAPTHLQLLGMAAVALAGSLLMPHPRWSWWKGGQGALPLLPCLVLGIPLAWGMVEALLWLYIEWVLPLAYPFSEH